MDLYNLDTILSVGYRVNSKRSTQFHIWASSVLRDHLLKGYSANERRLEELKQSLRIVGQVLDRINSLTVCNNCIEFVLRCLHRMIVNCWNWPAPKG